MLLLLLFFFVPAQAQDTPTPIIPELMEQRPEGPIRFASLMETLHPASRNILDQYWRTYDPELIEQAFPRNNPHWDGPSAETCQKCYVALRRKGCGIEHVQWCCCATGCCCAATFTTYGAIQASPYYITCGILEGLSALCNIWGAKNGVEQTKQFDTIIGYAGRPVFDEEDVQTALQHSLLDQ